MLAVESPYPMRAPARGAVFHPNTQQPATIAGAVALIAAVMALALVIRAASDGISFASFLAYLCALVLTGVAVVCGYWAIALNSLRYELIGGALMISWGLSRQVVPLSNMQRVVRGRALGLPAVDGLSFPGWGCHIGRARVPRVGKVLFYSTHRAPEDILYLITAETAYGLSPIDQQGFIQALQTAMGQYAGLEGIRQELQRHPLAALPFWSDRLALATAGAALLLALLTTAIIFARYTGTPDLTVLHFPENDSVGEKRSLLGVCATALAVFLIDLVGALALHRPFRQVAYILLMGSIFVEAMLVVAAVFAA